MWSDLQGWNVCMYGCVCGLMSSLTYSTGFCLHTVSPALVSVCECVRVRVCVCVLNNSSCALISVPSTAEETERGYRRGPGSPPLPGGGMGGGVGGGRGGLALYK